LGTTLAIGASYADRQAYINNLQNQINELRAQLNSTNNQNEIYRAIADLQNQINSLRQ
jgi:protein-arginine kinase activator protein McsA